ncbi:MAG: ATP-binding cassette domain-containing protein [Planctomycetota bacterium]
MRFRQNHDNDRGRSPNVDATPILGDETASDTPDAQSPRVLLQTENLHVRFRRQTILADINLQIPAGQTLAIIGESGCGKTVLMKSLVGLVTPTRGRVLFDDLDLASLDQQQVATLRQRFGFVFQNAALFDSMSVYENVAFPLRQHRPMPLSEERQQVIQRIQSVGLPETVIRKRPAELSGGMRKRVGLARALILGPQLVVYDEPTTGLDPIMTDVINELILETRRRDPVTSIVVTHDMRTARKIADRVVMLYPRNRLTDRDSQILFDGPPSALQNAVDARVRQFVRGEAGDRIRELAAN